MKGSSNTNKRVANYLNKMKEAMPEVRHQIEVYEKNLNSGNLVKPPYTAPQFNNA